VPPCKLPFGCGKSTTANIETDLEQLGVDYVDLMLLHGSDGNGARACNEQDCAKDLEQYLAMEALYNASKIKAHVHHPFFDPKMHRFVETAGAFAHRSHHILLLRA
jgi:aryl-alcohol dehydrogenase-like predicted oxidoreductase